jgi:protein-L-isoaspartate(D-aspartate) O-methyltransferase
MNIEQARFNMVEQQIRTCGVLDNVVLNLLSNMKRETFVKPDHKNIAFSDLEIPLPGGQKMLCPKVEARLVQELHLKPNDKVLEIGTGSGYVTALLAKLAEFVYSIEIDELNKDFAIGNLTQNGITNISIITANGIHGLPSKAPYDKIFIGGGLVIINDTIKQQLKIGGKLVGFIGVTPVMHAILIERLSEHEYIETQLFETDVDYLVSENTSHFKF